MFRTFRQRVKPGEFYTDGPRSQVSTNKNMELRGTERQVMAPSCPLPVHAQISCIPALTAPHAIQHASHQRSLA